MKIYGSKGQDEEVKQNKEVTKSTSKGGKGYSDLNTWTMKFNKQKHSEEEGVRL